MRPGRKTVGDRAWPGVISGNFDDPEKLIAALDKIQSAKGIYVIPNPVEASLLARAANRLRRAGKGDLTGDRDIVRRYWLMVDCDPVRPSGISATDAEHDAAIGRAMAVEGWLRDRGWGEPMIADSGNGGHLMYRIDLPTDDGKSVERALVALAARFNDELVKIDTTVFNPARGSGNCMAHGPPRAITRPRGHTV